MNTWFSVRVMYDRQHANGEWTKAKEVYLIDALSFTEAESRAIGEVSPFVGKGGSLKVTAMKMEDIAEIFNRDDEAVDKWYRVKMIYETITDSGKVKKTPRIVLVKGCGTEDATKRLHDGMKGTLQDYKIHTVSETQYMDVFFYALDKPTDDTR